MSDALATVRGSPRRLQSLPIVAIAASLVISALPGRPAHARAQDPAELVQPVLQNSAEILYPDALRRLDPPPQGRVVIKLVVGVDGVPRELEVSQALHPELDALALAAVGALRYSPGLYRGRPVEIVLTVAIDIAPPAAPPTSAPTDLPEEPGDGSARTSSAGDGAPAQECGSTARRPRGRIAAGPERRRG